MATFLGILFQFHKMVNFKEFIHLFMLSADWFIMIHNLPSHHDIFMRYCGFLFLVISYFSWSFLLEIFLFYSFFNKATFMFALLFCSIDFCLHLYYLFLDIYFRGIFFKIDFEIIMWFFILKYFSLLTYSFEVMFFLLHTAWIAHEFWFF